MFFEERKRTKPTQALKKMVYIRDKGICRLCGQRVDPFHFEVGHDLAHSRGGKLTLQNAILLCSLCNRSQGKLTLKQARKALGITSPEDDSKKALKKLSLSELRFLAKDHDIKVKGRVSEGFFSSRNIVPSRTQYVNALAKELTREQVENERKKIPKAEPKKRHKRKKSSFFF